MSVGELYNSSTHKVNPDNFNILMKYISGNDVVDISKVRALANSQTSAKDIRSNIVSAGTQGDTSYVAKANGKDICVRLGGLDWQVMYLSTDKSGNSILTLWLDNNVQDAWMNRSSPETGDYAFINGGLYSRYSVWTSQDQWEYPSNMYGTSYVSAVTLNNGGLYSIYADNKVAEAEQDSGSVFALFTMSQFGLTDHLITPRQVGWQENQSALEILTSSTTKYSNDAWSKTTSSQGFIFPVVNFASKEYSDQWADAYLWLPSMCETGYNSSNVGLWETSTEQRSNFDGITTSVTGSVGSDTTIRIRSRTMLRSGHTDATTLEYATSTIKSLQPTGTACHGDNVKVVAYAVRPALHINLNSMYLDVMEQTARGVEVGQIYNTTTKALDTNNVKILTKYITGNAGATSSTVSTNATEITDASEIRGYTISAGTEGGVAYYAKAAGQDVTVTIGGIEWTAMYLSKDKNNNSVLTLWMNGFKQNSWSTRSSTEGAYYGFSDGIMYSDYSANWSSPSQGNYPSNMYGTSYINAVTLNNGGSYATSNSAVTTATQSSSSVFAPYTMSSYGLTQYLVKPRNVAWQENQSAKDIEHVSFNYPNDAWSTSTSDNGFFSTPNGV
ncbi:MAG: hypothetical protein E7356_04265, partial [Clostridiales bacterium]|nr:hypothetical protein [Clostridiales bacterium]